MAWTSSRSSTISSRHPLTPKRNSRYFTSEITGALRVQAKGENRVSEGPSAERGGDKSARRGEDPTRTFQWYTPAKRRATLYEDVTVDSQPSVKRHLDRGWPVYFEDGRSLWSEQSTKLASTDWYEFRDP